MKRYFPDLARGFDAALSDEDKPKSEFRLPDIFSDLFRIIKMS